jgi:hypothetical protein
LWGIVRERDPLEDISVDASIILKWIFKKQFGEAWTDLVWVRRGAVGRHL